LRRFLGAAEALTQLYLDLVEPVMGYPRHRESIASLLGPPTCSEECLLIGELESRIRDRVVCVAGPAGSPGFEGCDVIGAPEGGLLALIEAGLKPLYVVGDLDVDLRILDLMIEAAEILLIHVHGDNMERVSTYSRRLRGSKVIYTSQVQTSSCVLPIGGFTDGDRALIVAMLAGAREVRALGYNFDNPVFKHKSITLEGEVKRTKLKLAAEITYRASAILGYTPRETPRGDLIFLRASSTTLP